MRFDWISGNWYFLHTEFGIIFLCNGDMTFCSIILESYVHKPRSMALDPTKGFIFFTKGGTATLDRSLLDGSNQTSIVFHKVIYPSDITLDLANEHIYWIDTFMDFVERVDYNGKNRWLLTKSSGDSVYLKSLHSVAIFENSIFVSSWINESGNHSVAMIDRHLMTAKIIIGNLTRPASLHVYHRQRQPEVAHPCRLRNGGCDQLCIPTWKNNIAIAQCMCVAGYRLKTKTNCVLIRHASFLVYTKRFPSMVKGSLMSTKLQPGGGHQEPFIPILNIMLPLAVDYNVHDQSIFFAHSNM